MQEGNSKPIDAKKTFEIMDSIIMCFENLPQARMARRINLDAKTTSIPGRTTREG